MKNNTDCFVIYKNVTVDISDVPIPYRYSMRIGIREALDTICESIQKNMNINDILNINNFSHIFTNDGIILIIKMIIQYNYPDKKYLITAYEMNLF